MVVVYCVTEATCCGTEGSLQRYWRYWLLHVLTMTVYCVANENNKGEGRDGGGRGRFDSAVVALGELITI